MWRIEEFDNVEPQIDTAWLREEIGMLRISVSPDTSAEIDPNTWKNWRVIVGLAKKNSEGELKSTRKRRCTQQQAALIVLLALWKPAGKPLIKDILGSDLNSSQLNILKARSLFNQWIEKTNGEEAKPLLEAIHKVSGRMTGDQLSDISELMLPGKRVPVGNLARLIKEPLRKDRPCSRAATEQILQWLISRTMKYRKCGEILSIDLEQSVPPN